MSLDALWPLAALDLDLDGDDELIVSRLDGGRQVWVLGMGAGRPPVLGPGTLASGTPAR